MDPAKRGQPLDEDDEFEEFDVDDWGPEQADPANAAMWDRAWDADEGPAAAATGGGGGGAAAAAAPTDAVGQHLRAQAERLARGGPAQQQQQQQQQQQLQQQQMLQQQQQQMQQQQQR
jgi:hypothetical protein